MYGADKTDRAAMAEIYVGGARVTCTLCGGTTGYAGTKLCDRCWELDSRVRDDPHLAEEILKRISNEILEKIQKDSAP